MLLKFCQHPHDRSSLGLEKRASSSKSQSGSDKCDFCGKSKHSKFKCIHKKQMSKGTNAQGIKNIWLPKSCGSNAFQDYFDDAKESRVKQVPKNQVSSKFQESRSRFKIQDSSKESRFKNQEKTQSR